MNLVNHHRLAGAVLAAALVLTGCGQKLGVHVEGGVGGQVLAGQQQPGGTATTPQAGGPRAAATTQAAPGTTGNAGTTSGGTATSGTAGRAVNRGQTSTSPGGGATAAPGGTQTQAPQEQPGATQPPADEQAPSGTQPVTGTDRTGVTDSTITVAFHAPVTGAAPLPAESFREASDLYFKYQAAQGRTFLGREEVRVLFRDDKYNPATARQVCRELAAEAFLVAGGGGTDQIQACGQLAGVGQFPYFSAGVTEAGLDNNPWYFAASMTYRQQGVLLAQMIAKKFPGQTFSAIITDTPNFEDALQGFEAGIAQAGIGADYVEALRHPKGDNSWYNAYAQQLDSAGVKVLYMLTSPVDYIAFAQQAAQSGYGPFQYVGVGVSMGLNAVLPTGCPEVDGGIFFSPFPGIDWARQNVPEFFQASEQFGTVPDDLAFALWGINLQLDLIFQRYEQVYGTDLTRLDFRNLVEAMPPLESGIFPAVRYTPDNHFGGQSVHVLQADCSKGENGEYVTLGTFVTGF